MRELFRALEDVLDPLNILSSSTQPTSGLTAPHSALLCIHRDYVNDQATIARVGAENLDAVEFEDARYPSEPYNSKYGELEIA